MNYAIIALGKSQYLVEEGKTYEVPRFAGELGKLEPQVLAAKTGDQIEFGAPSLDKIKVVLEIVEQGKGEKVVTRKFTAKSRYRKTHGHRKLVTKFKVASIK